MVNLETASLPRKLFLFYFFDLGMWAGDGILLSLQKITYMLDAVCHNTKLFIDNMPKKQRKNYGQFFTSKETARFMASLFNLPKERNDIYILDPGAGSGILSVALLERIANEGIKSRIHLCCYENDANILELLKSNLKLVKDKGVITLEYTINNTNYILSQKDDFNGGLFKNENAEKYDLIIGNPPYLKISKDAPEAQAMPAICYGAPNLYFLFSAMSIFNLKMSGEMVYIIPRSWTSGFYFSRFRKYLLKETTIDSIHLFESRKDVFDDENVLQETMIVKLIKSSEKKDIMVSKSQSNRDFENLTSIKVPYGIIVSKTNDYIYLVTEKKEVESLKKISQFDCTLPKLGLKMKTGLVVDFRARDMIRDRFEEGAIPLFYSKHIRDGKVVFPTGEDNEYIETTRNGYRQKNSNYLFVKRFTSKEEHRRLQSGIYLKEFLPDYEYVSTQNKINFIDGLKELSKCVVYGLFVLFNSSLYDMYYRILNGSTQVNSTEINEMPIPSMNIIEKMGRQLLKSDNLSVGTCDNILNQFIYE